MNWNKFFDANKQAIKKQLKDLITEDTYGQWTLTELLRVNTLATKLAELIVIGRPESGKGDGADPLMFSVKLKVLTRQACKFDKDGNCIDGFSRYKLPTIKDETFRDGSAQTKKYIYPDINDAPKKGDKVYVKRNRHLESEDKKWRSATRFEFEEKSGREIKDDEWMYIWKIYEVDKDGCITIKDPAIALQLLKNRGKRLAKPQRSKQTKVKPGEKAIPERPINNWHFEEVPPVQETPSVDPVVSA